MKNYFRSDLLFISSIQPRQVYMKLLIIYDTNWIWNIWKYFIWMLFYICTISILLEFSFIMFTDLDVLKLAILVSGICLFAYSDQMSQNTNFQSLCGTITGFIKLHYLFFNQCGIIAAYIIHFMRFFILKMPHFIVSMKIEFHIHVWHIRRMYLIHILHYIRNA